MKDMTARYAAAEAMIGQNMKKLIDSPMVTPNWISGTETFWYRKTTSEGIEFTLVDAAAGTTSPAFDTERLAKALGTVLEGFVPELLPVLPFDIGENVLRIVFAGKIAEVSLDTYTASVVGSVPANASYSPDLRWAVTRRDHNLYLTDIATGEERQLTTDGAEDYEYAGMNDSCGSLVMQQNLGIQLPPSAISWSPDSKRFITHRLDQREVGLMHLVRSSPNDGGRPQVLSYHYPLPGDEAVPTAEYFVFDTDTATATEVKCGSVPMPFVPHILYSWVWWKADGTEIYWIRTDRGDKTGQLWAIDPASGNVRLLVEETTDTHIHFRPAHFGHNVRVLESGEVLWWSERTGWGHLYLYGVDALGGGGTGEAPIALTSGDWLVRELLAVDEANRRVLFSAAGREPGKDLYFKDLYTVSLDGGEITRLTDDDRDHLCLPSESGAYFVDVVSDVATPAISVVRDASGAVVLELGQADATRLYEAGWTAPERFVVKAADGVTDIYAAIYKPHDFDPTKKYPVVEEIYLGPQINTAPLRFPGAGGLMVGSPQAPQFPALGFVVVTVDGRGHTLRHKAFRDHIRAVSEDDVVDDHVAAIKQLAETRPWMDIERGVGVFGHSGGGSGSTRAILTRPDFYTVAVSSSGNHDDRLNHMWWGEKFYGLVDEFDYVNHANETHAANLEGKLLLIHGEMDDNAVPHSTMRLVKALIEANKDFDLLIVPNAEHGVNVNRNYFLRRRWDFFVRHLMGETPPSYRIAEVPQDPELLVFHGS